MKMISLLFVAFSLLFSCKKNNNQNSTIPVTSPSVLDSYFSDTTTKSLGADTTPKDKLQKIPFVKDNDTSLFPYSVRIMSPSNYTIDVPPPGDQDPFQSCVAWAT